MGRIPLNTALEYKATKDKYYGERHDLLRRLNRHQADEYEGKKGYEQFQAKDVYSRASTVVYEDSMTVLRLTGGWHGKVARVDRLLLTHRDCTHRTGAYIGRTD